MVRAALRGRRAQPSSQHARRRLLGGSGRRRGPRSRARLDNVARVGPARRGSFVSSGDGCSHSVVVGPVLPRTSLSPSLLLLLLTGRQLADRAGLRGRDRISGFRHGCAPSASSAAASFIAVVVAIVEQPRVPLLAPVAAAPSGSASASVGGSYRHSAVSRSAVAAGGRLGRDRSGHRRPLLYHPTLVPSSLLLRCNGSLSLGSFSGRHFLYTVY